MIFCKGWESEDYIREIATFVNDELTKVKERNPFTNISVSQFLAV